MALVKVLGISLFERNFERLWGCYIDTPVQGSQMDICAIDMSGWVLSRESPSVAVEVVHEGRVIRTTPIRVSRPDVAVHYPDVPGAEKCGFWALVGVLGMAPEFELLLRVVLQDDNRVDLGVIRGRRQPLYSGFQPRLQPLMVTSLGRTGTTWLMRLLAEHPRITAYRRYPYEIRAAKYWMHTLKVLSEPANHVESSHWGNFNGNIWWVGYNPFYTAPLTDQPQLRHWFGRIYVEQLAAFCQRSIDEFYQQVASSQGQTELTYFAEKYHADHIPWLFWELYPQAREIILVRDFRDVVCSILATNAKRGSNDFGRDRVNSDEEYVLQLGLDVQHLLESWKRRSAQAHLLRYEDLILHPVETLKALLTYLDVDSTPATVESMLQRASQDTQELQQHRTSQDPKTSIGRWQHELSVSLQSVCQEAFGDVLKEFGYAAAGRGSTLSKYTCYQRLVQQIQEVVNIAVPHNAKVIVVSEGDEDFLNLNERKAQHFSPTEKGFYTGYFPSDSNEAIAHLEILRAKGCKFLLFPSPAFWWLDFYEDFRKHLDDSYRCIWNDERCIIYRLDGDS